MLTDKERQEIDPELCAEGLHRFLMNHNRALSFKELAVFYGTISLLYNCHADGWLDKSTNKYDAWDPLVMPRYMEDKT